MVFAFLCKIPLWFDRVAHHEPSLSESRGKSSGQEARETVPSTCLATARPQAPLPRRERERLRWTTPARTNCLVRTVRAVSPDERDPGTRFVYENPPPTGSCLVEEPIINGGQLFARRRPPAAAVVNSAGTPILLKFLPNPCWPTGPSSFRGRRDRAWPEQLRQQPRGFSVA